jgi:hypothetical protein
VSAGIPDLKDSFDAMARSVVFLIAVPFTEYYVQRFGVRVLESKGIAVHVINLSGLLNKELFCHGNDQSSIKEDWVYQINSYPDFEKKVEELSATSVFVDSLVGLSGIDLKHEKIFRILKKYHAKYYIIAHTDVPISSVERGFFNRDRLQRYLKIFDIHCVCYQITIRVFIILTKYLGLYPLPVRVFGFESERGRRYMRRYNNGRILYTPINSNDYSTYLDYVKQNKGIGRDTDKTCVFIDEGAIDSFDFDILKIKKLDRRKYLDVMNQFFNRIERETGLKVVIAAHPGSHYEQYPDAFEGRKIIKWKTLELVAKSNLVIVHYSAAVSYAVLFNKPVLIVKTNDMIKAKRAVFIDRLADELNLESINIEDRKQMDRLPYHIKNSQNANFDRYKYKYLVSKGVENVVTWDFIAGEIQKES